VSLADASLSVANFVHTGEFRPHSRFTSTSADLVHIHVPAEHHAALRWHADAMSTATRAQLRLGTSGWTYASWKGTVYPAGVADRVRLEYYAANLFDTVELNAGYYRWPALTSFESWHRRLPHGFRMTVKAPKGLTHVGHLTALDEWLPHITPALDALGDRLGLFLVQLPPALQRDDALLDAFLTAMPSRFDIAV